MNEPIMFLCVQGYYENITGLCPGGMEALTMYNVHCHNYESEKCEPLQKYILGNFPGRRSDILHIIPENKTCLHS